MSRRKKSVSKKSVQKSEYILDRCVEFFPILYDFSIDLKYGTTPSPNVHLKSLFEKLTAELSRLIAFATTTSSSSSSTTTTTTASSPKSTGLSLTTLKLITNVSELKFWLLGQCASSPGPKEYVVDWDSLFALKINLCNYIYYFTQKSTATSTTKYKLENTLARPDINEIRTTPPKSVPEIVSMVFTTKNSLLDDLVIKDLSTIDLNPDPISNTTKWKKVALALVDSVYRYCTVGVATGTYTLDDVYKVLHKWFPAANQMVSFKRTAQNTHIPHEFYSYDKLGNASGLITSEFDGDTSTETNSSDSKSISTEPATITPPPPSVMSKLFSLFLDNTPAVEDVIDNDDDDDDSGDD